MGFSRGKALKVLAHKLVRPAAIRRAAVAEAIKRQSDMGVDEFILRLCADDLDKMDRLTKIAARTV